MNLVLDPWVPVRDAAGTVRDISPLDIASTFPPALDLAACRPDFNGALAQFLIGLLQLVAPEEGDDWSAVMDGRQALPVDQLRKWAPHFEFDRGDCRVMQDTELSDADGVSDLDALLLESPGANAVRNNSDLFIKRRDPSTFGLAIAAQALITLQMNAPAGGQGHRTSIRGGGPVTYLWWPMRRDGQEVPLWQKLWANVQSLEGTCRREIALPWTAACLTSEGGKHVIAQIAARHGELSEKESAALCYFATPRRIRLGFADDVTCALRGTRSPGATGYFTKNFGANYLSHLFRHPLSSYYELKGDWLPTHLSDMGFSYVDWLQTQRSDDARRAPSVLEGRHRRRVERWLGGAGDSAIWAFGFKMDNMKCEGWHEARYPAFPGLSPEAEGTVFAQAGLLIAAFKACFSSLQRALRQAWTDEGKKGDTSAAERRLLGATEADFYESLKRIAEKPTATAEDAAARDQIKLNWQRMLTGAAYRVFESHAQASDARCESLKVMQRGAAARRQLELSLHIELPKALGMATETRAGKSRKPTGRKAA